MTTIMSTADADVDGDMDVPLALLTTDADQQGESGSESISGVLEELLGDSDGQQPHQKHQRRLDERRRKGRLQKQRFRKRQREQIDANRQLLVALENQYRALCQAVSGRQPLLVQSTAGAVLASDTASLRDKFVALAMEIQALRRGNAGMRAQLTSQDQFLFKLMQSANTYSSANLDFTGLVTAQPPWGALGPRGLTASRADASPLLIERATLVKITEYDAIIAACQTEIAHVRSALMLLTAPTMDLHGWQIRRNLRPGHFDFLFTKHFPLAPCAEQYADTTWRVMTSLKRIKELQPTVVLPQIVQVVDPFTFVVHRRVKHSSVNRVTCATLLLFKRALQPPARGFVIGWKSLTPPSPQVLGNILAPGVDGLEPSWVELFEWLIFDESAAMTGSHTGEGCTVTYGGHVGHPNRQYLQFLSTELMACACRWECAVTGAVLFGVNETAN